jgi:hypothetical protein
MADNISMTRIVDLPEGPVRQMSQAPAQMGPSLDGGFSNTYMPMDIHPNPYGMPPPPPGGIMPPEHTQGRAPHQGGHQQGGQYNGGFDEINQRLPQRDIPMNIGQHAQDEQIQPNYIPPPKITADYIQEYQETQDRKIREYEEKKMREKTREHWLDEFQIPVLLALLYFVYQLPIVNTMVFKRFSFLSIYNDDGNFNLLGLVLKSMLFAFSYYSIHKVVGLLD